MKSFRIKLTVALCLLIVAPLCILFFVLTNMDAAFALPVFAAMAAAAAIICIFYIRSMLRPVEECAQRVSSFAAGDFSAPADATKNGDNELLRNLETMAANQCKVTKEIADTIAGMAQGDLAIRINQNYPGEYRKIGDALQNLKNTYNEWICGITATAGHLIKETDALSNTAERLSGNTTEQTISISNLSQSMALVSDRAMHSTSLARKVANSGDSVKATAKVGAEQMNRMMQAVQEINEAGASIEKVIKVIDEIAFQTNILALNAAVEAARAGNHGKGFAVVADEVRNLAGKSADAARDTTQLISNTMQKADEGYSISLETQKSLEQIVEGIDSVTSSIVQVSESSDTQSEEIRTVNNLLAGQVQAVTESSITCNKTAQSGREAKDNAAQLQKMIGRFRLDADYMRRATARQTVSAQAKQAEAEADGAGIYSRLIWSDDLKMGDEKIDNQHRQLIETVDKLMSACFDGTASEKIKEVMDFLLEYTVQHFADEEALQLRCKFPGYKAHKKIHDDFKVAAVGLAQELDEKGPTVEMTGKINKHLAGWLLNHIKEQDKQISKFLRNK